MNEDKTTAAAKGDLRRTLNYWRELSPLGKAIWIVGVITSASSLASISENVVKWRGFFLHYVEFYHEITEPIRTWLNETFQLNLTEDVVDFLIIAVIVFSSMLRSEFVILKAHPPWWFIAVAALMYVALAAIIVDAVMRNDADVLLTWTWFLIGLNAVLTAVIAVLLRTAPAGLIVFWFYLIAILVLFGVAAGINAGLSAPAA